MTPPTGVWPRLRARLDSPWIAAVPGTVIVLVLWVIAYARIDFAAYTRKQLDELWQSLGTEALAVDFWGSLTSMHIQPPAMNVLYGIDGLVTPERHLVIAGALLFGVVATVLMLVDTLRRFGMPGTWTATAGIAYALLPGTVIYALWAYVTAPLMFWSMAAVWGVAVMRTRALPGAAVSAIAMLMLVLTRPAFAWFVLLAWCVALAVLLVRRRAFAALGVVGVALAAGLLVQLHYTVQFGLPVMSSWSGENMAKALAVSGSIVVTPDAEERLRQDPCLSEMLDAYREDRLNRWDDAAFRGLPACAALPALEPRGTPAWDSPTKGTSANANYNYSDRLVASREWSRMMTTIVSEHPWQVLRMALTSEYGPRNSGLGLYLSPSEDYPFVTEVRDANPVFSLLGPWSLVFAPAMWLLVVIGVVRAAVVRRSRLRGFAAFWFGSALLVFHLLANTLFEYSENMRYRAELDAVLLAVGVMVLFDLVRSRTPDDSRSA